MGNPCLNILTVSILYFVSYSVPSYNAYTQGHTFSEGGVCDMYDFSGNSDCYHYIVGY